MTQAHGAESALYDEVQEAVQVIRQHLDSAGRSDQPSVALILGSGLGPFADTFEDRFTIDYEDIPHFPVSSVEGHVGRLVFGRIGAVSCVTMQGRVHFYEGYDLARVTFPLRVMLQLGADKVVVTNAAGGLGKDLRVADLVIIRDHLNLFGASPLRGPNDPRFGPRFPDMTYAYHRELRELAKQAGEDCGLNLSEGVYAGVFGPGLRDPGGDRDATPHGGRLGGHVDGAGSDRRQPYGGQGAGHLLRHQHGSGHSGRSLESRRGHRRGAAGAFHVRKALVHHPGTHGPSCVSRLA